MKEKEKAAGAVYLIDPMILNRHQLGKLVKRQTSQGRIAAKTDHSK